MCFFLGANVLDENPFIVMPYMKNGNARNYLASHQDCDRNKLLHGASLGLVYLHEREVIHGDIKATNILIDDTGNAVLSDFAMSSVRSDMSRHSTQNDAAAIDLVGSRNWMAPEILTGSSLTFASDMYSFGMTIYEIFAEDIPLGHIEDCALHTLVVQQSLRPERPNSQLLLDSTWFLANGCWSESPSHRPIAREVCAILGDIVRSNITSKSNPRRSLPPTPNQITAAYYPEKMVEIPPVVPASPHRAPRATQDGSRNIVSNEKMQSLLGDAILTEETYICEVTKTKASFIEPLLHAPTKPGLNEVNQLHQDLTAPSATVFLLMDLGSDDASISSKDLPVDLRICLETFETILDGHAELCSDLRKCGQGQPPFAFSPLNVYNHHAHIFQKYATYTRHLQGALKQANKTASRKQSNQEDAIKWAKVYAAVKRLERNASANGETGFAASLSRPYQRLLRYPLFLQNLLDRSDCPISTASATLQIIANIKDMLRSIEGESVDDQERDQTWDAYARIEGLDRERDLAAPAPSRVLVAERMLDASSQTSFSSSKKELWLVEFNDVVLRCQRTGLTCVPQATARDSPNVATTTQVARTKPRNLYKLVKLLWVCLGRTLDNGVPTSRGNTMKAQTSSILPAQVSGFTVLPIIYPSLPSSSSSASTSATHILYARAHTGPSKPSKRGPGLKGKEREFPGGRTIFVVNVPPDATERELVLLFKYAGTVERVVFSGEFDGNDDIIDSDSDTDAEEGAAEMEVDEEQPRKKRKINRDDRNAPPEVTPLPQPIPSLRTLRRTGGSAHIVFLDPSSLDRAIAIPAKPRPWPTALTSSVGATKSKTSASEANAAADASPCGLAHYLAQHAALRPPLDAVREHADTYMALFEHNLALSKHAQGKYKKGEAIVDEDGFTLVTRGGAYGKTLGGGVGVASKKFDPTRSGGGNRGRKKKEGKEKEEFYAFQKAEKQRKAIMDLKKNWEADKIKVEKLKESRRFRPY
ncbi:hypothetical protein HWV62_20085 [Athelia sp. TMB]|nr:hypothetical protein HWV62_20085 [Athelia sp. TMB]